MEPLSVFYRFVSVIELFSVFALHKWITTLVQKFSAELEKLK